MFRVYIIETCINTIETGTKELFPLCTTFSSTVKGPTGAKHQSCMAVQALRYIVGSVRIPIWHFGTIEPPGPLEKLIIIT